MITCGPARDSVVACLSCGARSWADAPTGTPGEVEAVSVTQIFTVQVRTVIDQRFNTNLCAACLQDMSQAIYPYRAGV